MGDRDMTTKLMQRKGQLSFDLAFAIIMLILIFNMLVSYVNTSQSAVRVMESRDLMGLNLLADKTVGGLNSFYNSLIASPQNGTFRLNLTDDFLFGSSSTDYEIKYNITFSPSVSPPCAPSSYCILFESPGSSVVRGIGFVIEGAPSCMAIPRLSKNDTITFSNCKILSDKLVCRNCIIS